jgi:HD-like signal output (HDOD) protein/CheY-like chemotaxis protein
VKSVLIVDDLAIFREPIAELLRQEGFEVRCAGNGAEGLASLTERPPDLVLLDLGMPVMDGLEMLRRVRESGRHRKTPVIVLSADTKRERVLAAVHLGVSGYIVKAQFSLRRMLEQVRSALGEGQASGAAGEQAPVAPSAGRGECEASAAGPEGLAPDEAIASLKALTPLMSRKELQVRVGACDQLKALSPTVAHVLKLTANARCSIEAVARAIGQDQAMALRVLKLANSSAYTRGAPVDSVQKAVVRIGLDRIRQAVLNITVIDRFTSSAFQGDLSTAQFWEHGIAVGLLTAELAHLENEKQAESAFTMGLLHDVGRIIYAEQLGETYTEVIRTARRLSLPLEVVETRLLLMNHADAMESVLQAWKFAKDLVGPIVHHHASAETMRSVAPGQLRETARLALANRLAHALLLGSSGDEAVQPVDDLMSVLGLAPEKLSAIAAAATERTDDVKFAMLSGANAAAWARRRDELAAQLRAPLRPLIVSPRPESDTVAMFCRVLAGADPTAEPSWTEGPPNLAVTHIPNQRERASVSAALTLAEDRAGVRGLPTLVLSPVGKLTLEDSVAAGRALQRLATPMLPARFVAAVNQLVAPGVLAKAA